eukprot:TRINITY_DN5327_c0_g1_i1.p1 TRINITY_DN5327_c0_g1~~TRINITY_DN5327_c0_g1_i1.p1  ORF type:complete len:306 (-),score=93.63 TRINITY_DN5327_c0_g1_i1:90-977(-)
MTSSSSTKSTALLPTRKAQLQEIFALIDADKSGTVEVKELHTMLKLVKSDITAEEVRKVFGAIDKSKDGRIQGDEFIKDYMTHFSGDNDEKFHSRIEQTKKYLIRKPVLGKVFDHFDADKSGHMDKGELYRMVKLSKSKITNDELLALMKKIDTDNDKRISRDEFIQYFFQQFINDSPAEFEQRIEETLQGRRRVKLQTLFNFFDMDGNGELDVGEFALTLTMCGRKFVPADEILDALVRIDKDKNRKVDFKEWMTYMGSLVGLMDDAAFNKMMTEMTTAVREYRTKKTPTTTKA